MWGEYENKKASQSEPVTTEVVENKLTQRRPPLPQLVNNAIIILIQQAQGEGL